MTAIVSVKAATSSSSAGWRNELRHGELRGALRESTYRELPLEINDHHFSLILRTRDPVDDLSEGLLEGVVVGGKATRVLAKVSHTNGPTIVSLEESATITIALVVELRLRVARVQGREISV